MIFFCLFLLFSNGNKFSKRLLQNTRGCWISYRIAAMNRPRHKCGGTILIKLKNTSVVRYPINTCPPARIVICARYVKPTRLQDNQDQCCQSVINLFCLNLFDSCTRTYWFVIILSSIWLNQATKYEKLKRLNPRKKSLSRKLRAIFRVCIRPF